MDSRKYLPIPQFNGVVKTYHARAIPDTKLSDVLNVIFEFGKSKRRYGYNAIGNNTPLDGTIMDIIYYEQLRTGDNFTVVVTTTSVYYYDSSTGNFVDITEIYNTGTASCDCTALTGIGTTWSAGWSGNKEFIKLGTNDPSDVFVALTASNFSWTVASAYLAKQWITVTYGNRWFVAGSSDGFFMRTYKASLYGLSWGASNGTAGCTSISGIAYGNGVFVAVSVTGTERTARSTNNAADFTGVSAAELNAWRSIAYGNGTFVAVASSGTSRVMRSIDDGASWTPIVVNLRQWAAIAYGGGVFVAIAWDGPELGLEMAMRSTDDGLTWSYIYTPEFYSCSSIAYGNGVFVASSSPGFVLRSTDLGLTWNMIFVANQNFGQITYGDGSFVMPSTDGSNRIAISSDDGLTWILVSAPEANPWRGMAYGEGCFVSVSSTGTNRSMLTNMALLTVSSTDNLYTGMSLSGAFISAQTRIRSIDFVGGTITSEPAVGYASSSYLYADISTWHGISSIAGATSATMTSIEITTGDTASGDKKITNIPDTSVLYVGMGISGTGIDTESSIDSIDSATQITLSNACTADGTGVTLTFGVLVEAAHDVDYVIKHGLNGDEDDIISWCLPYSGDIDDKILLLTNGVDKIKRWDGSGPITDLSISGITCDWAKCIGYFGSAVAEHTIIANMNDGSINLPQTINISDAGDPTSYSGASYDLLSSNDPIIAMKALGTRLVIYKRNSISLAWATPEGGNTDPIDLDENKITNVGCPASRTIQDFGSYHIFLGLEVDSVNIYAFDGINVQTVGSDISLDLKQNIALPYVHRSFSFLIRSKNLYCLFVPTGPSEFPDKAYVYNYNERHWSIWELADFMTAYGYTRQEYNPSWAEIHATSAMWPDMMMRWVDLKYYSQDAFPILGDSDGYVYDFRNIHDTDNGTDIDAYMTTKDYPLNDTKHTFKLLEGVVGYKGQVNGDDIQFMASVDFGNNYCNPITISQDTSTDVADVTTSEYAETICNLYEKGRQARFQINNVDGGDFEIEGLTIGFTDEQGLTK